jgi:hypothetical protein
VVTVRVDRRGEVDEALAGAPSSARVRTRDGSSAVTRTATEVTTAAHSAADRMPTLACSSCVPLKARVAISRATVKPMPVMAPPPATTAHPTGGLSRPRLSRMTSHEKPRIPTGFPAR